MLADFIVETRWATLPEAVRAQSRMCLMDNLAANLSGTLARVSDIAAGYASGQSPGTGRATILLKGEKATPAMAAFANGCAANALDSDDGVRYAYGHAGAQIFPTALALAESLDLSGSRMLAAMVVAVNFLVDWNLSRSQRDISDELVK